jgi:hypothetical protein
LDGFLLISAEQIVWNEAKTLVGKSDRIKLSIVEKEADFQLNVDGSKPAVSDATSHQPHMLANCTDAVSYEHAASPVVQAELIDLRYFQPHYQFLVETCGLRFQLENGCYLAHKLRSSPRVSLVAASFLDPSLTWHSATSRRSWSPLQPSCLRCSALVRPLRLRH